MVVILSEVEGPTSVLRASLLPIAYRLLATHYWLSCISGNGLPHPFRRISAKGWDRTTAQSQHLRHLERGLAAHAAHGGSSGLQATEYGPLFFSVILSDRSVAQGVEGSAVAFRAPYWLLATRYWPLTAPYRLLAIGTYIRAPRGAVTTLFT
jgi:hypothetical protein